MIDLITGHQGFNHITAEQVAEINNAMTSGYGVDCVLRLKDGLVTSTGLAVGVGVGYWRANGYDMQMTTAETIYVDPSSVGTSRIDGFYVEILQDIASGNQRSEFVYVKGTEASVPVAPPDPTAPALTTDIMLQCVKFAEALIAENTLTLTDLTKGMEQVTPEDMELVKSWIRDNSDVYSSIVSHKKGEVVLNALDGKIYQCINNCGAFDWETNKSNYTEKTIVEILSDIALGGASGLKYGTCTTAASTTAKTAATANGDFELALGKSVCIRMTYANTASSPTLNVDGTGAKYIKGYGSELPSYWWLAGDMVQFVYDGTYYIMLPTQGEIASLNNDLNDHSGVYNMSSVVGSNHYGGVTLSINTPFDISNYSITVNSLTIGFTNKVDVSLTVENIIVNKYTPNVIELFLNNALPSGMTVSGLIDYPHVGNVRFTLNKI